MNSTAVIIIALSSLLGAFVAIAGAAAADEDGKGTSSNGGVNGPPRISCSSCPLTYSPVIDAGTGVPFYNDCLARCQLGPDAKLLAHDDGVVGGSRATAAPAATSGVSTKRASSSSGAAATSGGSAATSADSVTAANSKLRRPDFMRLVPPPASGGAGDEAAGDAGAPGAYSRVAADTITRFSNDDFFYVGRPGFIKGSAAAADVGEAASEEQLLKQNRKMAGLPAASSSPSSIKASDTSSSATTTASSSSSSSSASDGTTTVSLRITYPEGHMYMKVWSASDVQTMIQSYTDPLSTSSSPAASWAAAAPGAAAGQRTTAEAADSYRTAGSNISNSTDSNSSAVSNGNSGTTTSATPSLKAEGPGNGPSSPSNSSGGISQQRPARRLLTHGLSGIYGDDDRREITRRPSYPYTAVVLLRLNQGSCSGSLIGSTGRLVLTAAHCLFSYDLYNDRALGWYSGFRVAPGFIQGSVAPFGWHDGAMAEVISSFSQEGDLASDLGLLQLAYHYTEAGSLGYGYQCGWTNYSLTTAGYPGDKQHYTLWYAPASVTTDACSGPADTYFDFDAAQGQSGSALWTSDDFKARFVISTMSLGANGAVAITPSHYSWISDFISKQITTTPLRILVGGPNRDLFVRCDVESLRCIGVKSFRRNATRFYAYPIASTARFALSIPGTKLCLTLWGAGDSGGVGLHSCNARDNYIFAGTELWNVANMDGSAGGIPTVRSGSGGYLWWEGEQQMQAVRSCRRNWQCMWRLE